jgi:hypothetical protein
VSSQASPSLVAPDRTVVAPSPLVVQYLYVHGQGEAFFYPTTRDATSVAEVAVRYLECAVVQAASLRFRDVDCGLALATNITDRRALGRTAEELIECLEALDVEILQTEYRHRPGDGSSTYVSSRYVLDAILSAAEGQPPERRLLLTDLDCVWVGAERVFAAVPQSPRVGCIHFEYPPQWDVVGFGEVGRTPAGIGQLSESFGGPAGPAAWVGGELLAGTPDALRELVAACDEVDAQLAARDEVLPTEEQVLTLVGALGRVGFENLEQVASRVHTGPRHEAVAIADPLALGLWHLPAEKGLSLRRTAHAIRRGRTREVRRDFAEPARIARRFNVLGTGLARQVRDDSWIARRRVSSKLRSRLRRPASHT